MPEVFARSVARWPDRIAVEIPPGASGRQRSKTTYADLAARSAVVANRLDGLAEADRIVVLLFDRHDPDLFAAMLGVLRAGAAYTCVEPIAATSQLPFVVEDAAPAAIVTNSRHAPAARTSASGVTVVEIDGPTVAPSPVATRRSPSPRDLAYVIYTSGTTGRPKGVMIEHRSIANLVASDVETFRLTPQDRVAQGSSAVYDSSIEETWLAWSAGATLVVMDDETARLGPDLVDWLADERISVLCPPPTLLRTTGCADPDRRLPDLRLLYVGGEPLPRDVAATWARGRRLENGYGPTECTVTVVRGRVEADGPITIGRPVRGHTAHVVDDRLRPVDDGEVGELCIAGPGLARGYLGRAGLTERQFVEHPEFGRVYRTGDLVRRGPDGNLTCLGRIDTQVKIRGHRLETEGIETVLAEHDAVREAAVIVRGSGPTAQLVAYVAATDPKRPPTSETLRAHVAERLPAAAVPSAVTVIEGLPRTAGGKLDRKALAELASTQPTPLPSSHTSDGTLTEIGALVSAAVRDALILDVEPDPDGDFFDALGGDSLRAALVVTALRADERTSDVAVRDIYELRTIRALARRLEESDARARPEPPERAAASAAARPSPIPANVIQSAWLLFQALSSAPILWLAAFVIFPFLLRWLGVAGSLVAGPFIAIALLALWTPIGIWLAVLGKRILIGRYVEGRYPVWGGFHVRNWFVQQFVRFIPWGFLSGTVFMNSALRALGARIGDRVHIHRGVDVLSGGWDLLEIGDDVSLGRDAAVRLLELADGHVIVAPITIESGATLDVRAGVAGGATVERDAYLDPLSALPAGTTLATGRRASGVPALDVGPSPEPPPITHGRAMSPRKHGALMVILGFASGITLWIPMLSLMLWAVVTWELDPDAVIGWLFDPTFSATVLWPIAAITLVGAPLGLVLSALACRLLGSVPDGVTERWSAAYIRIWMKVALVEGSGRWLSGTLMWPVWLRAAGMKVGRGCEISTITGVIPEQVTIEGPSFLADGIYLGEPVVHRGSVRVAPVRLAANTFLGNHVVIPPGTTMPSDVLLGVCTVADSSMDQAGRSWFGHPAFVLPRREIVEADRELTHDPSPIRWFSRATWEVARFLLPLPPVLAALCWFSLVGPRYVSQQSLLTQWWTIVWVTTSFGCAFLGAIVVLKWSLLGRVRPGRHPLWSCWCSRWDFLYVAWGAYARGLLAPFEGTLWLPWYLRCMGSRIGRRAVLGGGFTQVVDPDMLEIGDDATVSCLFQAHSFEDRVLKVDHVRIGARSTVRHGALLLYGADVAEDADVAAHSVVMKRERLLPGRRYSGCPVRPE